jgi:murein DD-endopeptidase MepM/ murein hydrolase activator NlpD
MAGRVASYNTLRQETDALRGRYRTLQTELSRTDGQIASLEVYAREVSMAFGIDRGIQRISNRSVEGPLTPTFAESVDEYNLLRTASHFKVPSRRGPTLQPASASPSLWPVDGGRIMGGFGDRIDPFSGEGAFHSGVDISGAAGTPVRTTADGMVVYAQWLGGYGKMVVVDHGGGVQTVYAHLSRYFVNVGETVTRGQFVGAVGATGKTTAPHLHYEVRVGGSAVNPYLYHLAKSTTYQSAPREDTLF